MFGTQASRRGASARAGPSSAEPRHDPTRQCCAMHHSSCQPGTAPHPCNPRARPPAPAPAAARCRRRLERGSNCQVDAGDVPCSFSSTTCRPLLAKALTAPVDGQQGGCPLCVPPLRGPRGTTEGVHPAPAVDFLQSAPNLARASSAAAPPPAQRSLQTRPLSPPAQPMNTSPHSSVSRLSMVRPCSMPPSSWKAPAKAGTAN